MVISQTVLKRIYIIKQIQRYLLNQEIYFLKDKALIAEVLVLKKELWGLMKFFSVRLRNKREDKDQLNVKVEA
jgi:hypothetical protein